MGPRDVPSDRKTFDYGLLELHRFRNKDKPECIRVYRNLHRSSPASTDYTHSSSATTYSRGCEAVVLNPGAYCQVDCALERGDISP
jgi:hypothetical protein